MNTIRTQLSDHAQWGHRKIAVIVFCVGAALMVLLATPGVAAAQTCVDDLTGVRNNCTANDVSFGQIDVLDAVTPTCAYEGQTITVTLRTRLTANASERYDIGLFIAQDGGNARTGACFHDSLRPVANSSVYSATSGVGPFYNGELSDGADVCGDLEQSVLNVYDLQPIQVVCRDADNDGYLDVGSVISWDNTDGNTCASTANAVPNTKAKCLAVPALRIPIAVPGGDLEIVKTPITATVNAGQQVGFTIRVTNTVQGGRLESVLLTDTLPAGVTWTIDTANSNPGCSIVNVAGAQQLRCNFGTLNNTGATRQARRVTVRGASSIAQCPVVPNRVDATWVSVSGTGANQVRTPGQGTAFAQINVLCSSIEVDKVTVPGGAAQPFAFTLWQGGRQIEQFSLTDASIPNVIFPLTPTVTYSITEATPAGWNLTSQSCTDGYSPTSITPQGGATVTCTFVNTRQTGTLIINKIAQGADATFGFSGPGSDLGATFQITTSNGSGSRTFSGAPTGAYTVTEGALPAGWDFSGLECSDPTNNTTINGATAAIQVGADETVSCTFTNVRRGSITITKSVDFNGFENDPVIQNQPYEICLEGVSVAYGPTCSIYTAGASLTIDNLQPGDYRVYEQTPTASEGWMIGVAPANPVVLAGQDTPVTVSNMPLQGELVVIKTVNTRFTREYQWEITKTVTPPTLELFVGDTGAAAYTLDITRTTRLERDFAISGTVTISNPSVLPVWINQPVDVLSTGGTVALACGVGFPYRIDGGAQLLCSYDQTLAGVYTPADTITNTVTVSLTNNTVYRQEVPFAFTQPTTEIDDEVTIADPIGGLSEQTVSGNLSLSYTSAPTCDAFSNWENGGNAGSYTIVNTAALTGATNTASAQATLTVNCYRLGVAKSVLPSYTLTTTWDITKTVDDPQVDLFAGASQQVTYTVLVTQTGAYSGSWRVDGTITISNPAPLTANLASVEDILNASYPGVVATCTPNAASIPPNSQITCDYTVDLSAVGAVDGENVARAVLINNDSGVTAFTGSQAVNFTNAQVTPAQTTVAVDDSVAGALGEFTTSGSTTYTRMLDCSNVTGYVDGSVARIVSNVAAIVQTGQSDGEDVNVTCYVPTVTKDVTPAYTIAYTWQLDKAVNAGAVDLFDGDEDTLTYTVTATRDNGTAGGWVVNGVISVTNPHPSQAIALAGAVADTITGGVNAAVQCPASVAPQTTTTCTYSASLPDATNRTNTATLTLFGIPYTGTAAISFAGVTPTAIDPTLTVTDNYAPAGSPWTFNDTGQQTYTRPVNCSGFNAQDYAQGSASTTVNNIASAALQSGAQLSDNVNVALTCYRPSVSKTATPTHVITYTWDLTKTADAASVALFAGDSQVVNYTIDAVRSAGATGSWAVSGTVTVLNPHPREAIPAANLSDALSLSGPATLDCNGATAAPPATGATPGSLTCTYAVDLASGAAQTNTATLLLYSRSYTGAAPFAFNPAQAATVNDSLTVTDTIGAGWTFTNSGSQTYSRTLDCDAIFGQIDYGVDGVIDANVLNEAVGRGDDGGILTQDSETVTLACYQPTVSKTVATSYTRTYTWTVEKLAAPPRLDLFDGETATVTYTIDVVKSPAIDSAFSVTGVIAITNPHPAQAATFTVSDVLPGGLAATVDCGGGSASVTVGAGQTRTCAYTAAPAGFIAGANVATATMTTQSGARSYTGQAGVSFDADNPTVLVDNQVGVSDSNPAFGAPITTDVTYTRTYTVDYGCTNIDFGQGTVRYQQQNNTVIVDKTIDEAASATVDLTCYLPTVTKTARGAYGATYDWTLTKTANPARLDLFEGESRDVTYTIDVTRTLASQQDFVIDGSITISNPNPVRALQLAGVVDQLNTGQQLPNGCGASVPAGTPVTCNYGGAVSGAGATSIVTNTATITTTANRTYSSAPQIVDFNQVTPSQLYDSVTIEDSQTSQTWPLSDSSVISYTLSQGCANVAFADGSTTFSDVLANTASVRELIGRDATATVARNCYRLAVSKDVNTAFTRQHFWDIAKTVTPDTWDLFVGDQVTSTYTVTAFIVNSVDSDWQVAGTITISNPAPMDANIVSVVDVLPNGVVASVECAQGVTAPANSTVACGYSAVPGAAITGNNTVTVTLQTSAGVNPYIGAAPVTFGAPTTELSATVNLTDDRAGALGVFTNGQTATYPQAFTCADVVLEEGETNRSYTFDNTAAIDGTTATDTARVTVTCWKPPVLKTATTSYNRIFDYDLEKLAAPAEQTIYYTDTATFTYTLQVTKFIKEENGFAVAGTIVISNPAPIAAELTSVEDILPDAVGMAVVCAGGANAPYTVPAGGELLCTYQAGLPDKSPRVNTARATLNNGALISDTAPVDFSQATVTPINDSAAITDTYFSDVWTVFTDTQTTYSQSFTCDGAVYDEQTGFFRHVLTNLAAVLLPGGDQDAATVTLNCYRLGLTVQKTATPTTRPEPGGEFTFDVLVVNISPVPVLLTSLHDSIYGDLTQVTGRMTGTTCALPATPLTPNGGQYACRFTAAVTGAPGLTETDVVTATGIDAGGNAVTAADDATVALTNTPSSITLTKTASQNELAWPGGEVIFTVAVQNASAVDTVTLTGLTDSIYGDITQVIDKVLATTCTMPQTLLPGGGYTCTFTVSLTLSAQATTDLVETNVVTAIGVDDDGEAVQASDDETVRVVAAPRATIGDRVFVDIDPNGANSTEIVGGNHEQDFENGLPIEDNVPGIVVLLFTPAGDLVAQTITDASGAYSFTDVPPGDYYIVFVNDGAFNGAWTGYDALIDDAVNSDVDPSLPLDANVVAQIEQLLGDDAADDAVRTPTFTIEPGQNYLDVDAGLIDLSGASSVDISGIIWIDANRDGIRQPEEVQRVAGVVVELYLVDSSQPNSLLKIDQMTTGSDGFFEFLGLDAGVYVVKVVTSTLQISPQDVGSDDTIDSDVNPLTGESSPQVLNGQVVAVDVGVYQLPTALDPEEEPVVNTYKVFLPALNR